VKLAVCPASQLYTRSRILYAEADIGHHELELHGGGNLCESPIHNSSFVPRFLDFLHQLCIKYEGEDFLIIRDPVEEFNNCVTFAAVNSSFG